MADDYTPAGLPPDADPAWSEMSDKWVITLMYGIGKNIYDGPVERFNADRMFEAATYLSDALEAVMRTAARERARADAGT